MPFSVVANWGDTCKETKTMELMAAHHQWASRPADERYWTLKDMFMEALFSAESSTNRTVRIDRLGVEVVDNDLQLTTPHDGALDFSHWSFGQFCTTIGAPANYIRTLEPSLAKANLESGLRRSSKVYKSNPDFQMYFNENDKQALALTRKYGRVHNHKIVKYLMDMEGGWRPPPARPATENDSRARLATAEDVRVSTLVKEGDMIAPAGLYLSQEDMFCFLVDPDTRIADGTDGGLSRGFFVTNSEVGKKRFKLVSFLYRFSCGNHIVWGAQDVESFSRTHMGDKVDVEKDIFSGIDTALAKYQTTSAKDDEALIVAAKHEIWSGLDDLRDMIFGQKKWLGKKQVDNAYALAEQYAGTDGSPRSVWGFANAVTRLSQLSPYADERSTLDMAAGKMLRELVSI
jgi:hypothetical protein